MSILKEKIEIIHTLRKQKIEADEQLYFSRLKLNKADTLLQLARKKEKLPLNKKEFQKIRALLTPVEEKLHNINREIGNLNLIIENIRIKETRLKNLDEKTRMLKSSLDNTRSKLSEELETEKPDRKLIKAHEIRIKLLNKRITDLNYNPEAVEEEEKRLREQREDASRQKDEINSRKKELQAKVDELENNLANESDAGNYNIDDQDKLRKDIFKEYENDKIKAEDNFKKLQTGIENIYIKSHPRDYITELDDSIPFFLLPLRLETRFVSTGENHELWLRVYPDDIAVHTHEKLLTDEEVNEGIKYWKELFNIEKTGGDDKEEKKEDAWSNIASIFGPQRSAWIARETKPTNWSSDLSGIPDADQLQFPSHDLTKTSAWSRAPRTKVLPDKFVVILYDGDTSTEIVGPVINDELMLGPEPLEEKDSFKTVDDKLLFGESFNWTSDFDKAVTMGMGFKIKLTSAQAVNGFDKILVLGVSLSSDEEDSRLNLEELIDNHHYSSKGFSIVTQGSPTNNTDSVKSDYTSNDQYNNTSYFVETGDPLFSEDQDCDARNLADFLGIEYESVQYILNADATDYRQAVMMNKALYPGTLGYYIEVLLKPVFSEENQDKIREFFVNHVTGRGPLPSIRVGNQPYGILLTSDFSKWAWKDKDRRFDYSFLNTIHNVLSHYNTLWEKLLPDLMYVGKPNVDSSDILMDVLGLQPGSATFYQRTAYSSDYLKNLDDFKYGGKYYEDLQKNFTQKNNILSFLHNFGYDVADESGLLKVPQLLRLIFQHYNIKLDANNLIDDVPLSEEDLIQFYDESLRKNYLHWLSEASNIDTLEKQDFGADIKAPNALLYLKIRRALLLQLHKSTVHWFRKQNLVLDHTLETANFYNIKPQGDLTKYEVMRAKVGTAVPNHPKKNMMVSDYLMKFGADEEEVAFLNEMRDAIKTLAEVPTEKLKRCLTEHLDTLTYRLDAWQSALFRLRLLKQRNIFNEDTRRERKKGIYMGAYGWLEDIKPAERHRANLKTVHEKLRKPSNLPLYEESQNGGFIHAPSLNHASAAAVLRAGYLNHADKENPELMAVNLSSERIRRALFILQGIRNGQPLEALLGYQFERNLHDIASDNDNLKKLNLYIYNLRAKFPYEQHHVSQQGSPSETTEIIPPNSVINGVTFAEYTGTFPYGATGDIISATTEEVEAIKQEKDRLADTLDAVKDLMLAESTYQMVQGNYDRSGAVLNSMKDTYIPQQMEVINTPRSSRFTFTNRITVQYENTDPNLAVNNPWDPIPMTPRAKIEAGLNKWLGNLLGNPANIIFKVAHLDADRNEVGLSTMKVADLSMQPIDLVYIIGNELNTGIREKDSEDSTAVSELENRIAFLHRQNNNLENDIIIRIEFLKPEITGSKNLGKLLPLLRMLKSMITDSRHLHAEDFTPSSKTILAENDNPKGYDDADLINRYYQCASQFKYYPDELDKISIDATVIDPDENPQNYTNLKDTFAAMDLTKVDFSTISFTFNIANTIPIMNLLIGISGYGLPDSFPTLSSVITDKEIITLLEQTRSVTRKAWQAYSTATGLAAEANTETDIQQKVEKYIKACKSLLGDVFNIMPLFVYNNGIDIKQSNSNRAQLLSFAQSELKMIFPADEWLQNVSHVRPKIRRWDYIRTLTETINNSILKIKPIQLPYRTNDSWLAVEFPKIDPITSEPFNITHDTLSIIIQGANTAFNPIAKQSGLLIDDWTELIPTSEEITGIAFNYNQPNACPPQAILLAVTPLEKGYWTWDDLVGILNNTLKRAKLRAVEPKLLDTVEKSEQSVLLPAIIADFSQYDLNISLDLRMNLAFFATAMPTIAIANLTSEGE
ncbi:MAG: hypothetical protein GY855_06825 [candidate division Zixibacteria bacterium]|nr:hypothetical protein [candidate division Zixibacteria bacterium]